MRDWRVGNTFIAGGFYVAWAWSSAWVEHKCETARCERYRRRSLAGLSQPVTGGVGSGERAGHAGSPTVLPDSATGLKWKPETATLIVLGLTLAAIRQAILTRHEANAVVASC